MGLHFFKNISSAIKTRSTPVGQIKNTVDWSVDWAGRAMLVCRVGGSGHARPRPRRHAPPRPVEIHQFSLARSGLSQININVISWETSRAEVVATNTKLLRQLY